MRIPAVGETVYCINGGLNNDNRYSLSFFHEGYPKIYKVIIDRQYIENNKIQYNVSTESSRFLASIDEVFFNLEDAKKEIDNIHKRFMNRLPERVNDLKDDLIDSWEELEKDKDYVKKNITILKNAALRFKMRVEDIIETIESYQKKSSLKNLEEYYKVWI